jgi:hypothetical protein
MKSILAVFITLIAIIIWTHWIDWRLKKLETQNERFERLSAEYKSYIDGVKPEITVVYRTTKEGNP